MEKSRNLKQTDSSKYNLRCNRNISEKMTKKDFIYDIPAPFQAMRKDKCLPPQLKKSRNYECLIKSSGITGIGNKGLNQTGATAIVKNDSTKLNNKNQIGLLRLIEPQRKLSSEVVKTTGKSTNHSEVFVETGEMIRGGMNGGIMANKESDAIEKKETQYHRHHHSHRVAAEIEKELEIRRQIVLPIQLRRKIGPDSKPPRYSVISDFNEEPQLANNNGLQIPELKILAYECNYCNEKLATFLSLSTHVKYHRKIHCNTCFWILEPQESMIQHLEKIHPVNLSKHVSIPR